MAELRAVILVDNIGNEQLKGEWGLSIYLEFREKKILLDADVKKVYTGHCTGERAFRVMKDALGSRVEQFHVGLEINL